MNTPRCPYCRARAAAGTYGDAAAALPVHFCPRVPGPSSCPYAGAPIAWAPPATDAQRAQAQEFETRLAAARLAAAAASIRDMAPDNHILWTTAATIIFLAVLIPLALPLDEDSFHIPRWLLILLAGFLFALLTYLRERHLAARRASWLAALSPLVRQVETAPHQTTTTATTATAVFNDLPTNTPFLPRTLQDS